ncbi:MAG: outer membrane lipoprotein-sorting protein [Pseudomonadales bacterium]|nr:outer membrane lipoprotein-sorting protein [Pseudomonadales bacterium]|tara:strand:+ start:4309 stop:5670 length:1362 start_codon:yes stop_codon:yes gene_type:complete
MISTSFHAARIAAALSATLALSLAAQCIAAITPEQAARLGQDLTPIGGEVAGNSSGSIPAYTGGLATPPENWSPGQGYVNPFADEQPLFTITAANMDQYQDHLTPGMQALLTRYPQFSMPVYPTHRTAALPEAVEARVKEQATVVSLNGYGLENLNGSTTPFPIPANGLEAIWNHNVRYLGGGVERTFIQTPVRASGDYTLIRGYERRVFDQNMDKHQENHLHSFIGKILSPASLTGNITLVHEPIDQTKEPRSAWIYSEGQRRVRRAPIIAYDAPIEGSEGLITNDEYDGYNGAPDRYDWQLLGKKEMYVPYNAYDLKSKDVSYSELLQQGTLNSSYMRYELHRVWVVQATVREGERHMYQKRTFFLDEDSWSVVSSDVYDSRGELWRVALHPIIQYYDANFPWYAASLWHDLLSGAYLVSGLANEEQESWKFNERARASDFEPSSLRRMGN